VESRSTIDCARALRKPFLRPELDTSWMVHAKCADHPDPDVFFPERGQPRERMRVDDVRLICATCPVRKACLDYAHATKERFGIWGGTCEKERRELRAGNRTVVSRRAS
jgi:WhiB family redox-sensing transcriptional regulator